MADSFLFSIAETVLRKLTSPALEEFSLVCGLQSDVKKIKRTMVAIHAVLLDAEQRQSQNHAIEVWLKELKDVLYDIEDVVDEFECEALRKQIVKSGLTARKVRQFIRYLYRYLIQFCSTSNPFVFQFKMAHMLKNIRERLVEIAALRSSLGLTEGVNDMSNIIRRERALTHSFVRVDDVIGREDDKENIINMLLQPIDGENVSIIPIVGIGGLGKTTLAKLVYNDKRVVSRFEKKIWVCVSEEFELQKLLVQILQSLGVESRKYANLQIDQLQNVLRESLDGKRYLLILDDVWNEDSRKWIDLKELLLGGSSGSRIIVTTRSNRVASIMGTRSFHPYNLHDLPHEHCLSLFFKYAFKEEKDKQNPELVRIGEEIVRKCNGVPLAVITLATLLNSSTNKREWESIRDSEMWRLEQRENDILPALKLSYKHLPPHLKRCFAYCSIFPKDYVFDDVTLVYFWMANGLIQASGANQELEDVGLRYLKELRFRYFFQDFHESRFDGFIFKCKMHDLMHDLAKSVTKNEIKTILSSDREISKSVRHLSFPDPNSLPYCLPQFSQNLHHVRSVFSLGEIFKGRPVTLFETCLSRCHYLRYLPVTLFETCLSRCQYLPVTLFETCLSRCHYLRYLHLSYGFEKLPKSIGNLKRVLEC